MEIRKNNIRMNYQQNASNNKSDVKNVDMNLEINNNQEGMKSLANYNVAGIKFKGYYGNQQPAKKLFWILTGRNQIYRDNETDYNTYYTGTNKKWVTTNPEDLLKRTPEQAIQSICTLNNHLEIPGYVLSPNYGDKWGRRQDRHI